MKEFYFETTIVRTSDGKEVTVVGKHYDSVDFDTPEKMAAIAIELMESLVLAANDPEEYKRQKAESGQVWSGFSPPTE